MRTGGRAGLVIFAVGVAAVAAAYWEPDRRDDPASLASVVAQLVSAMPARGSDGYVEPARESRETVVAAFRALAQGKVAQADVIAGRAGYTVNVLDDRELGRLFILREAGSGNRGWGMFVHRPGVSGPTVEAPHPVADLDSEVIAVEIFAGAHAANLFVAGAHRAAERDGSADVARRADTVFAAVDRAAATDPVIQLHGFDAAERDYGDVVVSAGNPAPTALTFAAARSFEEAGFAVCVFGAGRCSGLGATTNVQGASARSRGRQFLHVELSRPLRSDPDARERVVRALVAALDARRGS